MPLNLTPDKRPLVDALAFKKELLRIQQELTRRWNDSAYNLDELVAWMERELEGLQERMDGWISAEEAQDIAQDVGLPSLTKLLKESKG